MNDYQPISCAFYDLFEIAIMRHQQLILKWRDEKGNSHRQRVQPRDLRILGNAECLIAASSDGQQLELRLDRILKAQMVDNQCP